MLTKKGLFLILMVLILGVTSCQSPLVDERIAPEPKHYSVNAKSIPEERPEENSSLPQVTPIPTPTLVPVTATVFQDMPEAPVLMYHRFNPKHGSRSEQYKVSLSDLDSQLEALYHAGYSLVPLDDWLRGEIILPEGRKPLIITIDDLFYADQISLDANGDPAPYSGIGRIWQFYQEHPDFNFHLALFYNFGDKGYPNRYENGSFYFVKGWEKDRAEAIAWVFKMVRSLITTSTTTQT